MQQSQTQLTCKQHCRLLRHQGYAIGHIAKLVKRSGSTVHWHVRDISLTTSQKLRLRDHWRAVMVVVNARRRGRPLKPVPFRRPAWSKGLVHLVAHLSFDGRVDRYGCAYYSRSHDQVLHVKQLLHRLLGLVANVRLRSNGIWIVSCYNVAVAAWLSQREEELLRVIAHQSTWQQQWLQAFFDDEGHVHVHRGIRRVRASQHAPQILQHAQEFLRALGIQSRVDPQAKAVEITGRENLFSFQRHVNFSSGIRVNAHRKNGVQTNHVEKRRLLARALNSYRAASLFHNSGR